MKCDELKYERLGDAFNDYPDSTLVIRKQYVDAAIAELNAENRSLKRALWLARAERAMAESYSVLNDVPTSNRWVKALNKLKTKAEEYK